MDYLHTMIRVRDADATLDFFCNGLGMVEIKRMESEKGRFTLIFLSGTGDAEYAKAHDKPLLELTYNWPTEGVEQEIYEGGRNFGHLAYRVDNIYEICERLQKMGVIINRPPRDGHMAFVKSPDGISVELLQKGNLPPEEPWLSMENSGSW